MAELNRIETVDYGNCRDCGATIMWRWNDNTPPRKMIIDRTPDPKGRIVPKMDGTVHVLTNEERDAIEARIVPPDLQPTRYTEHHVTCPHADKWRKKR